jgi:RNA polymerase sigma-70 factor (ECF subfamily)
VNDSIVYCIVPRELAAKLHEPLRRHFADDPRIEVVVEQRDAERRAGRERRAAATPDEWPDRAAPAERRRVRSAEGRRVGERRAANVSVAPPRELPRRLRAYADRVAYVERAAASSERDEDVEVARAVNRIQAGDRQGFAELYLLYFDRVYEYLRALVRDHHEAEDLAQQTFLESYSAIGRYERRDTPFRAWLFTIARNRALDHLRRHSRVELDANGTPERHLEREQSREVVRLESLAWISDRELMMFVDRLPIAQRQVIVLRFMLEMTHAEIAGVLGRSATDVRTLQHRGLRFLEQRLIAIGREPLAGRRGRMRIYRRQAPVLRMRRFSLSP